MKITKLRKKDKNITSQFSKDWMGVNIEHFGQTVKEWKTDNFFLYASEKGKPIGYVHFDVQMGVCDVKEIVVKEHYRRKGVGKKLMKEVETMAKEFSAHIVYLTTGKDWKEKEFYESIGYRKVADLNNHFLNTDFVYMAKEI